MQEQNLTVPFERREIVIFTALAYAFSWAWWGALIFSGAQTFSNLSQMNADEAQSAQMMIAIGDFGPLLAALIMRLFVSREGLKGSMGWKRPFKWYLASFLTPILFFGILAVFNHLTGLGRFAWTRTDMPFGAYLGIELLIGAIVRDNEIHNYFNGIYTGSSAALENPDIAFDADIYDNYIHHIRDDGLEPEGACINQRFRDNRVDTILVGISIAPVTQGPTWVVRNLFANFSGTSIKWARDPDGILLIYHNTGWTNSPGLNAMSVITPMKNSVMANNIFQGNGYVFEAIVSGATGNDWNYNNWHTTRGSTRPHFKWENINYQAISLLCAATGLECNGHENPPGLVNPSGRDFTLLPTSPNIDRGIFIPGINDNFIGSAPDLGVYEYGGGK